MIRNSYPVTKDAIHPMGEPNMCFYCGAAIGEQHKPNCVMREKTIIIEFKCNLLVSVPEFWDKQLIEFSFNESSYCRSTLIEELQSLDERVNCICPFSEVAFIREATKEDETDYNVEYKEENGNE